MNAAKAFKLGYEIHSIDLPPDARHVEHPGQEHGRLVQGLAGVHLHRGNGVEVALEQWQKLGRPKTAVVLCRRRSQNRSETN